MDRNDSQVLGHDGGRVDTHLGGVFVAARSFGVGLAHTQLGMGVCAGCVWCFHCDHEIVPRHRELAFDGRYVVVGVAVAAAAASAPCALG